MRSHLLGLSLVLVCFAARPSVAEDGPPKLGDKATDFALQTMDGKTVSLYSQTKDKPVILVVLRGFPGYQCPVCSAQVRSLTAGAETLKSANVLFVYPGPAKDLGAKAEEFLSAKPLPNGFQLVLDPDYKFTNQYHLRWDGKNETAYPSTFLIDSQNTIRFAKISKSHGGRASIKEIKDALRDISKK